MSANAPDTFALMLRRNESNECVPWTRSEDVYVLVTSILSRLRYIFYDFFYDFS
jgi:hypothetical protein